LLEKSSQINGLPAMVNLADPFSSRRIMKLIKDTRGMELVEAAITTPIAIMVMVAIVNLGMLVYAQQAVQAAARHGARMGSVAQQCPAC
jgi:Flp pilus assembly protein TadG